MYNRWAWGGGGGNGWEGGGEGDGEGEAVRRESKGKSGRGLLGTACMCTTGGLVGGGEREEEGRGV